ncbi:TetR/AcrR family transcriptional regulator [Sansalvadorimonas verongulae]|uniref:TetR/AcrR family transcriptional regulator n=1 Tax=Sansalvadorimonas verongulae TaxID=2172824 RepID=UPI0012BCBF47|nr:TetR/AcrR family transcriptional regulator [Sansalvadorimonas verongulae]MTI15421.1 TetR family transcriptional regulator [Sansalvadorimonas verongulae]
MARPRRSENIRQELLDLGVKLLSENGYNGTGLKQILDAAGVPKGSFYNYFPSKEVYASEIIEYYMGHLLKMFNVVIDNHTGSPLQIIRFAYRNMITHFMEESCHRGCLLGNMAAEISFSSQLCRETMCRMYQQWRVHFAALLAKGQEQGEVRSDMPPETLADLFWNQWEGALLRMQLEGTPALLEDSLELTLDRLFSPVK